MHFAAIDLNMDNASSDLVECVKYLFMVSGIFLLFITGHLPVLVRQTQRQHINIYWLYFCYSSNRSNPIIGDIAGSQNI